ncbi:RNA-guided endonuclease IscB [Streptomyces ipomoeae]|uniref:RNA-guided endonuclease IscB n=1 Tax=Streptomyces ipomoeae TaxID=103232 RepID=UPI00114713B3|nr:RNA-guided endonuclease IscB [Streptomyces ipomoeae]MDX2932921.1 RNA-guided endonuclease IscB [Streptomyces ipomoeae]TQE16444.1 HNH endonuclease [Streptomyces ipomoeae]
MTTLPAGEQTHQAVLPQQPALESVGADTPGSRNETAHGHPATARGTGGKHGRGETDGHHTRARRRHAKTTATAAEAAENRNGDVPTHDHRYAGGVGAGRVFVLSKDGQPLMPCHPARARELLGKGRAVVARQTPFTIRLKDRTLAESEVDGVQLRIDPGSKGTGLALTHEKKETSSDGTTVTARRGLISVELQHRGDQIRMCMQQRAGYRHRRRSANCRYRAPRSHNRAQPRGWLPPSLRHRVDTTTSMATRMCRYAPVTEIHVEVTAFDTHSMSAGRTLTGTEYENGPLTGTNARAYLHAKWGSACAYCDTTGVPLNIDHLRPRSRGGSNRISNLVLACAPCNQAKGNRPVDIFLAHRPERLAKILQQVKAPLQDAAAMNTTRWRLLEALEALGRPVHDWPGTLTKQNRTTTGLEKTHTLDALCVGPLDHEGGDAIVRVPGNVLVAKATGRGSYARTTPDRFGFPRLRRARAKQHFGYVTGDLVRATMPSGKWAGTWTGRISVRARGQHSLTTPQGRINVSHRNLRLLQRGDGYGYARRQEMVE